MSTTIEPTAPTPADPVPAIPPVTQSPSELGHFLGLCSHAAALIYHDVLAVETKIEAWRSDNPALAGLFDQGLQYVSDVATSFGLPVTQGLLVVKTIGAALKQMAANDPTVKSGSSVVPA
jgi:hypothetical protein